MRNWLIGLAVIFLAVFWQVGHLTYTVMSKKSTWEHQGEMLAKKYTEIEKIDKVSLFHGDRSYLVVQGEKVGGAKVMAWFREEGLFEGFQYMKDLVSMEVIQEKIKKQSPEAKFFRLQPGMDQRKPIWETVWLDKDGKYNYSYYDMKTGNYIRSFRLQYIGM